MAHLNIVFVLFLGLLDLCHEFVHRNSSIEKVCRVSHLKCRSYLVGQKKACGLAPASRSFTVLESYRNAQGLPRQQCYLSSFILLLIGIPGKCVFKGLPIDKMGF